MEVEGEIVAGNRHSASATTHCFAGSCLRVTTVGGSRTDRLAGIHGEPSGEAIVMGAIGSAAPWFLTGWAHDVEIEFMIDTGCQVTILSTTVFQRMCTVNRPCRRRLVSADSSPLMVQGQFGLDIVFPGLCCKMVSCLWWPTLVLTVYWAQRLYSPIYHTNWISGQVSCGQMDSLRCSCTNSD